MERKSQKRVRVTAAAILAGGKGTRMGGLDKAFLQYKGKSFLDILLGTLKPLFSRIVISTNSPKLYEKYPWETITDSIPGMGPLGGMLSILERGDEDYFFLFLVIPL